jgi:tetratricopeptide (TPR) repeat protein
MVNIAMWMIEDADYGAAEPLLRDAVILRRKLLGDEHIDVASSLTILASLLIDTGRFEEARKIAIEAKSICLLALAEDHWRTAAAVAAEGAAMAGLKKYDEAEILLLQSHALLSADGGALSFHTSNATRWLADLYERQGRSEKAAEYLSLLEL